jgi:hypothetical protein
MVATFDDWFARVFATDLRAVAAAPAIEPAHNVDGALIERFIGIIAERVSHGRDERELLANVDELLESGVIASYMRPLYNAMQRDGLLSAGVEPTRLFAGASLCQPARALLDEATRDHEWIARAWQHLSSELGSGPLFDDALFEHGRRPLWYLSELPVDVAELMLRAERGLPALLALSVSVEHPQLVETDNSRQIALARMVRDAARATLRLMASARPSLISLDVVPADERFDVEALAARRRLEDDRLLALAAEAEAKNGPVLVPGP